MTELEMAYLRHEKRKKRKENEKDEKRLSRMFSKILLSLIFVLSSTIFMKLSDENKEFFKTYVFENNLAFTKMNEWYQENFGHILPSVASPKDLYASSPSSIETHEKYLDGYKVTSSKGNPITALGSGLFVFMGEKEGYGNTYILQGVNGVDIWYGGLENTDLKLYDYVDEKTILGTTKEDYYYLVFQKDGEFMSYEEYFNQVAS